MGTRTFHASRGCHGDLRTKEIEWCVKDDSPWWLCQLAALTARLQALEAERLSDIRKIREDEHEKHVADIELWRGEAARLGAERDDAVRRLQAAEAERDREERRAIFHGQEMVRAWQERDDARQRCASLEGALRVYADCSDGCTCGDGWSHDAAIQALTETTR